MGILLAVGSAGLLSGCTVLYRLPVQQGQVISKSHLNDLYKGMTESSVLASIGAPLLKDPWYPRTWVYVYSYKPAYGQTKAIHIYLHFGRDGLLQSLTRHLREDTIPFGRVSYSLSRRRVDG